MITRPLFPPEATRNFVLGAARVRTATLIDRIDALFLEYQQKEAAADVPPALRITLADFLDQAARLNDVLRIKQPLNTAAAHPSDTGLNLCQLLLLFRLFDLPVFAAFVCTDAPLPDAMCDELGPYITNDGPLYEERAKLFRLAYPHMLTQDAPAPGGEEVLYLYPATLPYAAFIVCRFLFGGVEPSDDELGQHVLFVDGVRELEAGELEADD